MAALASVPDCTASHVLNDASEAIELARGTLLLIEVPHHHRKTSPLAQTGRDEKSGGAPTTIDSQETFVNPSSPKEKDKDGVSTMSTVGLVLEIGESAFPLRVNTLLGRLTNNPRVYLFTPDMHIIYGRTACLSSVTTANRPSNTSSDRKDVDYFGDYKLAGSEGKPFEDDSTSTFLPEGGYVRITLPEGVLVEGSELRERQREFEDALVKFGLLKANSSNTAKLKALAKKCLCCT